MHTKVISSKDNQDFKTLKSLLRSRGIDEHNLAIISGPKFIADTLANHLGLCSLWVSFEGCSIDPPRHASDLQHVVLAKLLFDELDEAGTKHPLLVVKTPPLPTFDPAAPWSEGLHLFLPLQTPDNVGAVIRSAVAFNAARVVILREGAHPFHPKALRTSGVTALKANFAKGPSFSDLPILPVPAYALDMQGESLDVLDLPKTFALLVGLEGPGLQGLKIPCTKIRIPMANGVDSLNAAVAASLVLFRAYSAGKR